jgi:hypothetical protein
VSSCLDSVVPCPLSLHRMISPLKVFLEILRIFRFASNYIKRSPKRWASFIAYVGRKLIQWRRSCQGNAGTGTATVTVTVRNPKPVEPANGYWVSVAASEVPASAALYRGRDELSTAADSQAAEATLAAPVPRLQIDQLSPTRPSSPNPNRSSDNLSVLSRASNRSRISIITIPHPQESLSLSPSVHAANQPSRSPRAIHRQFGRGPVSRSPSPTNRRSRSPSPFREQLEPTPRDKIIRTDVSSRIYADGGISPAASPTTPAFPPPLLSYNDTHELQSPPAIVVTDTSTELLPITITYPTNSQPLAEESLAMPMDSPIHLSPVTSVADQLETASQLSNTASSISLGPPDGRTLRPTNSDLLPRYERGITM